MLESLTGKVLNRFLSQFFEDDLQFSKTSLAVWSGYIKLVNLKIKASIINEILASKKLPLSIVHCSIRSIEVTVPWSNLKKSAVIVLDGVHVLVRLELNQDDGDLIRKNDIKKRRRALENTPLRSNDKKYIEKILPTILGMLQLHIRDVHIRMEGDVDSPFGCGVVLSSMHVQHDEDEEGNGAIHKIAMVNKLGVYWNALDDEDDRLTHNKIAYAGDIGKALDQTISRPLHPTSHTYVLIPVDGVWKINFSSKLPVNIRADFDNVSLNLRDFQLLQVIQVLHLAKEFKYSRRHRHRRPMVALKDDPRAWWLFAVGAIKRELTDTRQRWSWARFRERIKSKSRYCELFEKSLRPTGALTVEEQLELRNLEDGLIDEDLSVQDILLYRIFVGKKLGVQPTETNGRSTWLRRKYNSVMGEDVKDEDYERLLEYWDSFSITLENGPPSEGVKTVAMSLEICVAKGQLVLFSPLASTADLPQRRRLQEHFLNFVFSGFRVQADVLADYDSFSVDIVLQDFLSQEIRSNRTKYDIIYQKTNTDEGAETDPLLFFTLSKNSSLPDEFSYGVHGTVRCLILDLFPACEWIARLKTLIQPLPQISKVAKFWKELNMANINSWASRRLGLLAKAQSAVSDHKSVHVSIDVECPVINVVLSTESTLVADFGRIEIRTVKLAGISGGKLFQDIEMEPITVSVDMEDSGRNSAPGKTPAEFPDIRGSSFFSVGNVNSSVFTGGSMGLTERFVDEPSFSQTPLVGPQESSCDVDCLFYDHYAIYFSLGGLRLETKESLVGDIVAGFSARIAFFRSIIPSDHTLSRYKVSLLVEEIMLSLSRDQLSLLISSINPWMDVLHLDFPAIAETTFDQNYFHRGGLDGETLMNHELLPDDFGDDNFDINEYFDAAEDQSESLDSHAEDVWIPDTESEIRSPIRRRRRQASISDVSSISEGSLGRRRIAIAGNNPLTADNLARLEEEDPSEDSGSRADSFHSAVSVSDIRALCQKLEVDIAETETSLSVAKTALAEARRDRDDPKSIRVLRLRKERLDAEILSLKAAYRELFSQISCTGEQEEYLNDSRTVSTIALRSARNASTLLRSVRGRRNQNETPDLVHNATNNLKRRVLECSITVKRVSAHFSGVAPSPESEEGKTNFWLDVSMVSFTTLHRVSEAQMFFSVDGLSMRLEEEACEEILLLGGITDPERSCYASNRHASILHLPTQESMLLSISYNLRQAYTLRTKTSLRVVRFEVFVGEVEASPSLSSLSKVSTASTDIGTLLSKVPSTRKKNDVSSRMTKNQQRPLNITGSLQIVSVRFFLVDNSKPDLLMSLSDCWFRAVVSLSNEVYSDRVRVDGHCGNAQIFILFEPGIGLELFGKQDSYSPAIVHLRTKAQLVPAECTGGWVVGYTTPFESVGIKVARLGEKTLQNTKRLLIWNCHIGLTADSVRVQFGADILNDVGNYCVALSCLRRQIRPKKNRPASEKKSHHRDESRRLRWKADFVMKEMSICLRRPGYPKSVQYHDFELSFGLTASSEISKHRDGICVQFVVSDLCMTRMSGLWSVLVPTKLACLIDVALNHFLCGFLENPHLLAHKAFKLPGFEDDKFKQLDVEAEIGFHSQVLDTIKFKVDPIKINVSSQISSELIQLTKSFLKASTFDQIIQPRDDRGGASGGDKRNRRLTLSSCVESIVVQLSLEGTKKTLHMAKSLALFSAKRLNCSFFKSEECSSLRLVVDVLSLVDSTVPKGIRSINIQGGGSATDSAVEISIKLSNLVSRISIDAEALIGNTQCLLLPSLVRNLFVFLSDLKQNVSYGEEALVSKPRTSKTEVPSNTLLEPVKKVASLTVNLTSESFELLLASQNLSGFVYPTSAIGTVSVRSKSDLSFRLCSAPVEEALTALSGKLEETVFRQNLLFARPGRAQSEFCYVISVETDATVSNCEVLRTTISKSTHQPAVFTVSPTAVGEQRITGVFSFGLSYHASMTVLPDSPIDGAICLAHSLRLRSDLLDVLVYESTSVGGLSDAYKNTIRPVLSLAKTTSREPKSKEGSEHSLVKKLIMESTLVVSYHGLGLKFTLVPGGATRLTESPILKFEISNIELSCGATVAAKFGIGESLWEKYGFIGSTDTTEPLAGTSRHFLAGASLCCEVTASYHNRRLVIWEPFIEPWKFSLRIGMDVGQSDRHASEPVLTAVLDKDTDVTPLSSAQTSVAESRLEQIGKLLRTPFKSGRTSTKDPGHGVNTAGSETDFCFILLSLISGKDQLNRQETDSSLIAHVLPGTATMRWLRSFGLPASMEREFSASSKRPPSIVCTVSDFSPLNLNLTGALIDNIVVFSHEAKMKRTAPHLIRNESGITLRFTEVLEDERRVEFGERARKVILRSGSEIPLSLKRLKSQSCDPHKAYLHIELGNFEETVERFEANGGLKASKGSRSSVFSYRIVSKIPVDEVGIYRFPLDPVSTDARSRSFGSVIVRVALIEGVKVVSIESPVLLKNSTDFDFLCEIRSRNGIRVLWNAPIPKRQKAEKQSLVPIPVDLVPELHSEPCFVGCTALGSSDQHVDPMLSTDAMTQLHLPPPYSENIFSKGIVRMTQVKVPFRDYDHKRTNQIVDSIYVDLCGVRIGSFALDKVQQQSTRIGVEIPEQRMLVFRSPLSVWNFLALPIQVHLRPKHETLDRSHRCASAEEWNDVGIVDCFQDASYSLAETHMDIEMRIRLCSEDKTTSRQFPWWSTPVVLKAESKHSSHLTLKDRYGARLILSVSVDTQIGDDIPVDFEDIRSFSSKLSDSSRIVRISSPVWIVDCSGLNLQYRSRNYVAGQDGAESGTPIKASMKNVESSGIGELLDGDDLPESALGETFRLQMLCDDGSSQIYARRRPSRSLPYSVTSSWSKAISLTISNEIHKVTVPADLPDKHLGSSVKDNGGSCEIGIRVLRPPGLLGEQVGTKLVHVFCRFFVVNELGREIDICQGRQRRSIASIKPDSLPHPFHPNELIPLRFRPAECGWRWSGKIRIGKSTSREVILQLSHEWKEETLIVSIIFFTKKTGSCTVVFRKAGHSPYRIENHTMFPITFRQIASFTEKLAPPKILTGRCLVLPHHDKEFAFDEPEFGGGAISFHLVDFRQLSSPVSLGTFKIGELDPGVDFELANTSLRSMIVADGPTRVFRITESLGPASKERDAGTILKHQKVETEDSAAPALSIQIELAHGVGLSVVDWTPQEIVYFFVSDISGTFRRVGGQEKGSFSVASITADNQIWVTPFPVLLRIGNEETRRNKRAKAMSVSWCRSLPSGNTGDEIYIQNISLSSLPCIVSVDGNLADKIIAMAHQAKALGSVKSRANDRPTKTELILSALDLRKRAGIYDTKPTAIILEDLLECTTTTAIASKPIVKLRSSRVAGETPFQVHHLKNHESKIPKQKQKIYVERLRLSTITAKISWSGALPVAPWLPRLLRPALTFESLPLLLRPYTASHAFGSVEDHLDAMRSHYISIWRIFDLLVGVLSRPTFFARAIVFTWRESCASVFSTATQALKTSEATLAQTLPRLRDGYFSVVTTSLVCSSCFSLRKISSITDAVASLTRYSPTRQRAGGSLVRRRNPRLFANIGGNDLLVEYTEGSNAGKALLSRISFGAYLSEGYVYHTNATAPNDYGTFVLMLSFEKLLLVNGEHDENFCQVRWEILVSGIVNVFIDEHEILHLYYISKSKDYFGLRILQCHVLSVEDPRVFLSKLAAVNPFVRTYDVPRG